MASETNSAETFVEKPKSFASLREEIAAGRTKAADLAAGYYARIENCGKDFSLSWHKPQEGNSSHSFSHGADSSFREIGGMPEEKVFEAIGKKAAAIGFVIPNEYVAGHGAIDMDAKEK